MAEDIFNTYLVLYLFCKLSSTKFGSGEISRIERSRNPPYITATHACILNMGDTAPTGVKIGSQRGVCVKTILFFELFKAQKYIAGINRYTGISSGYQKKCPTRFLTGAIMKKKVEKHWLKLHFPGLSGINDLTMAFAI